MTEQWLLTAEERHKVFWDAEPSEVTDEPVKDIQEMTARAQLRKVVEQEEKRKIVKGGIVYISYTEKEWAELRKEAGLE